MTRCIHCGGDDHGSNQCSDMPPAVTGDVAQSAGMRRALEKIARHDGLGLNDGDLVKVQSFHQDVEIARAALAAQPPAAPVDLTNHHNALKCPYCNPKGLQFAEPQEGCSAGSGDDLSRRARELADEPVIGAEGRRLLRQMATEIEDLRHDIDRHIQIATDIANEPQPVCTWPNCDQPSGHDYCYGHCLDSAGSPTVTRPERASESASGASTHDQSRS